jgi:hypothetical protein
MWGWEAQNCNVAGKPKAGDGAGKPKTVMGLGSPKLYIMGLGSPKLLMGLGSPNLVMGWEAQNGLGSPIMNRLQGISHAHIQFFVAGTSVILCKIVCLTFHDFVLTFRFLRSV